MAMSEEERLGRVLHPAVLSTIEGQATTNGLDRLLAFACISKNETLPGIPVLKKVNS